MQKLQLAIPEPCHENWQQMTPTDKGRFCNACAKEVVDFSTMTDMQVLNYFSTLTHEKVCGRALPEQLNRTISRPEPPKKRLFWYWNYIVMFLMFFTKGNGAKAQGDVKITTELSPVKQNNINELLKGRVGGLVVKNDSRVITGKVTDIDGNPISFASIKIKGTSSGVSADANGAYSLRVNPNTILIIAGASFKTAEVSVGNQSIINTVLESGSFRGEIIVTGGMGYRNADEYYGLADKAKRVAVLKVKDEETGKSLPDVSVAINNNGSSETVFTDIKGAYKIKGIKNYDRYFIKVSADGYESNEFTISESDFKDRKKEWEVLLRKEKAEETRSNATVNSDAPITIRGGIFVKENKGALYVVDGIIMPHGADINPDDVEDYAVIQGPEAAALFGPDGANGAIVITTKKLKVKDLDPVFIESYGMIKGQTVCTNSVMGGMVSGVTIKSRNSITDSLKMLQTKLTGAIKVFPNPVQRGNAFSIALQLTQAGLYQLQITDAAGRIILQKQVNAVAKEFTAHIKADERWGSGLYYISLIDNKNKLISKTSFIFQ